MHNRVFLIASSLTGIIANKVDITPHDMYSSSVGALGCKLNTNRVAYWPSPVDCDNICVKLTYDERSLYLLKIDQSAGAYDVSYDAWNYLAFGEATTVNPHMGGAISMIYEFVDADNYKVHL